MEGKITTGKRGLILLVICMFSYGLHAQRAPYTYAESSEEIANPERGWYDHTQTSTATYANLDASVLKSNRENDNVTLILRLFYLSGFVESSVISEEYQANMQSDFDAIREAGIKAVVRFAYSSSQTASTFDATPERVFSQIESMRDVLEKNSDVIAAVQAGFIGAWGEWYFTNNWADNFYSPLDQDQDNRKALFEKLLDVFPEHVVIQGRTPAIMQNALRSEESISDASAFDGADFSRIGHHNDCFVASSTDFGTYTDLTSDLNYLNQTTKYTIAGGETCNVNTSTSNCVNSVERLQELHWTYLNRDYNVDVLNEWKDEDCYDDVNLSLGYRLVLKESRLPSSGGVGQVVSVGFQFENVGYAAPTQFKNFEFILKNKASDALVVVNYTGVNSDLRYWLPGIVDIETNIELPNDIAEGTYLLGIRFSDRDDNLASDPSYSIRLANDDVWDEVSGVNYLGHEVSVVSNVDDLRPLSPSGVILSEQDNEITITWTDNATDETSYQVWRSTGNDGKYDLLASPEENASSYVDNAVEGGVSYFYAIQAVNSNGASELVLSFFETELSKPLAPSELRAIDTTPNYTELEWVDNSSNETGFFLERSDNDGVFEEVMELEANVLLYKDSDVQGGQSYVYRVKAFNELGDSEYSSEELVVIPEEILGGIANDIYAFNIYPNPVDNGFVLLKTGSNVLKKVRVTDLQGVTLFYTETQSDQIKISTQGFETGLYVMTIFEGGKSRAGKIIIE